LTQSMLGIALYTKFDDTSFSRFRDGRDITDAPSNLNMGHMT